MRRRRIDFVSPLQPGSTHDLTLLQRCFAPTLRWFDDVVLYLDLGFQGVAGKYDCPHLRLPIKRKKPAKGENNELSDEQKAWNRSQASERVSVEHAIGGMKRYRVLANKCRLKSTALIETVVCVCAGLWNFIIN